VAKVNILLSFDPQNVDWLALADLYERAPLGKRDPAQLKRAFEKSYLVCFAFDGGRIVGAGRLISDGEYYANIYDVAVLPEYQGKGIGAKIMGGLLDSQKIEFLLLTSTIGNEPFYRKHGFRRHKTAMALYRGAKAERGEKYLE
jgi:aralkylamine N-acetyltransferase